MRRIELLGAAAAGATLVGAVGFVLVQALAVLGTTPAAISSATAEPELVTGSVSSRPASASPQQRQVALAPPANAVPAEMSGLGDAASTSSPSCTNPTALGVSRVVEIDTTGGPGFGFEHFKQHDFLRDKEVVLTFDDGPWPTTDAVVRALAEECTRATFFVIGKHATYYPEILRNVSAAGHTIGSHTWSHQDLSKKSSGEATAEIEKAISAVQSALGDRGQGAPFFRFPALRHPPEMVTYLGQRNIAIFSTDMDSFDFKLRKPEQIVKSIMAKLQKQGKGIVLMHDFQSGTANALPQLLTELKAGGYKVVHMKASKPVTTLPQYDAELQKQQTLPTVSQRATSSVVRDVE